MCINKDSKIEIHSMGQNCTDQPSQVAFTLFSQLLHSDTLQVDVVTFSAVLTSLGTATKGKPWRRALEVLKLMKDEEVQVEDVGKLKMWSCLLKIIYRLCSNCSTVSAKMAMKHMETKGISRDSLASFHKSNGQDCSDLYQSSCLQWCPELHEDGMEATTSATGTHGIARGVARILDKNLQKSNCCVG